MAQKFKIAFSTGVDRWWKKQRLAAKYLKMRAEGVLYPDVYCIPYYFADGFDFLQDGEEVEPGRYDLILSELQGSVPQQRYLQSLVRQGNPPVAVIPGPPEILSRDLTDEKLAMVKEILSEAQHVWAYSHEVKNFADGLIGRSRAEVIPWPFNYDETVRLGRREKPSNENIKVLLQAPLRFCGVTQNHSFVLKSALLDAWSALPSVARDRVSFHTFVYTEEDRRQYHATGFANGLPIVLEAKKSYRGFVGFVGSCNAVVNLTVGSILGRLTFLAAALDKPGIFSANSETNETLYPESLAGLLNPGRLSELLRTLLLGLATGEGDRRFMPRMKAAADMGNLAANRDTMRAMVSREQSCAALLES